MELTHITLEYLSPARANVRKVGVKDIADLTASIGALGLLQPLLVLPKDQGFEIVAGLCCTNRLKSVPPLTPDGFRLRAR